MSYEIIVKPYFNNTVTEPFNQDSWLIVTTESETEDVHFSYISKEQVLKEGFESIGDFVEVFLEHYPYSQKYTEQTIMGKGGVYTEVKTCSELVEDFDDHSGNTSTIGQSYAFVIEAYSGGIGVEDLEKLRKNIIRESNMAINESQAGLLELSEYKKDPYGYHGVNRRDF